MGSSLQEDKAGKGYAVEICGHVAVYKYAV